MKPIIISDHARERMILRGATEEEIERAIRDTSPIPAKEGRLASRKTFVFNSISPVNGKNYAFKTVEAIWVEEPTEIVLVSTKVFYHDRP